MPKAYAAENTPSPSSGPAGGHNQFGLIAVLVDNRLLDDTKPYKSEGGSATLRERIFAYAQNAQNRIPHSKAFVMGIDPDESTFKIATVLEKMYNEGADLDLLDNNTANDNATKEDDNRLIGIVLVGDVPIPVAYEQDGVSHPSLYPYTDFYRKRYIYNYKTDRFEANPETNETNPEIWHGVIVPPAKDIAQGRQQLADYFYKNNEYSQGKSPYADFQKRMVYADFPSMDKQLSFMDFRNYQRYIKYMEEQAFYRYTKPILKKIIAEVTVDMSPETPPQERKPVIPDDAIEQMPAALVEFAFKKYTAPLEMALQIYRGKLNEVLKQSGRWLPKQVDTPTALISMRDEYAKINLHSKQLQLEDQIDQVIRLASLEQMQFLDVVTGADVEIWAGPSSSTYHFNAYVDGQPMSLVTDAQNCGMYRGQRRPMLTDPLDNNSVYVEANRMYNPDTALQPPKDDEDNYDEDWELKEDPSYKVYAGCTANNFQKVDYDNEDEDIHLHQGPDQCHPDEAIGSVFDIVGSREVKNTAIPEYNRAGGCGVDRMTFHPGNDDTFNDRAVGAPGLGKDLDEVLYDVYNHLIDEKKISPIPEFRIRPVASAVMRYLVKSGKTYTYPALLDINIKATKTTKKVPGIVKHVEPLNSTIQAIKKAMITPDMPADGIRFVEFQSAGGIQHYDYPNVYRIKGENVKQFAESLLGLITQKQQELNQKTGKSTDVILSFFLANTTIPPQVPELIRWNGLDIQDKLSLWNRLSKEEKLFILGYSKFAEPMVWKPLGTDQKLALIIQKYIDRDSFMPVAYSGPPNALKLRPEILHIVAAGDAQGYQFGLNNAAQNKSGVKDAEREDAKNNAAKKREQVVAETGQAEAEQSYVCGDPKGVEIWEWFNAFQCWLEKEILPAKDLFSLDNSCGGPLPAPETSESEAYVDPATDTSMNPQTLNAQMGKRSLAVGDTATIKVIPLNDKGESIMGYIDAPVRLQLDDASLGIFEKNDFNVYKGDEEVKFTALKTGNAKLSITMGNVQATPIEIHVFPSIRIQLADEEKREKGKVNFTVTATLLDPAGNRITDVNSDIVLAPEKPMDGAFVGGGVVSLKDGQGQIIFLPNAGATRINLITQTPFYTLIDHAITPPPNPPVELILRTPRYIPVGGKVEIPVSAVDVNGLPSASFSKTITVKLTKNTKDYATVVTPTVTLSAGKGKITVQAEKETGSITLIADHPELASGQATVPILARVEGKDWAAFPENLFASFVGFPAGNFLEKDYFGGTHLFRGTTEAVFSFMTGPAPSPVVTIGPDYQIKLSGANIRAFPQILSDSIGLTVYDNNAKRTVMTAKIPLDFEKIALWEKGAKPEAGALYLEALGEDFGTKEIAGGIELLDANGNAIGRFGKNSIQILNPRYSFVYVPEPEAGAIELQLTDGMNAVGRLLLNPRPRALNPDDFGIDEFYAAQKVFGGKSTNDPGSLLIYNPQEATGQPEVPEYYGLQGENKYLTLFAGGAPAGEAVKSHLPPNAVLLGDPTIQLKMTSNTGLDYDASIGRKIFQDPLNSQIVSINHFNFNNDGYEDLVLVTQDGRVRLLTGGPTDPPFQDKGDLAFLADGALTVEPFDFKNDGYEDLLIATHEGRLAILHNDKEVITRTDQSINVGKKIYTLLREDMDMDGQQDLVVLDSRGDIRIFYNESGKFAENGYLVANYGFSLTEDNLANDLKVRYPGIKEPLRFSAPNVPETKPMATPSPTVSSDQSQALQDFLDGKQTKVPDNQAQALYDAAMAAGEQARKDPVAAAMNPPGEPPPKLPWPEGDKTETYFAKATKTSFLTVDKRVGNKDRPDSRNIDLEEKVLYTLTVTSSKNADNIVIADTVPDALTADPQSAKCESKACEGMKTVQKELYLFFGGLNLTANEPVTITYEASVKNTPRATMFIQKIAKPAALKDDYPDILVSPPYNNTNFLIQHYSVGSKKYAIRSTENDKKPPTEGAAAAQKAMDENAKMAAELDKFMNNTDFKDKNLKIDPKQLENMFGSSTKQAQSAIEDAGCESKQADTNIDQGGGDITLDSPCLGQALDDLAGAINDFVCMGGGCYPIPFNFTFMVPPQMPIPLFAFPTTIWPLIPVPVPSLYMAPSPLGASVIPNVYISFIRIYTGFSLTGGIGIAMCFGPYTGSAVAPPPIFPIPYPPPIGNCLVQALPIQKINPSCGWIEDQMNALMQWINSGIAKVNSAMAQANNSDNLPAGLVPSNPDDASAGGLQISLGVNLGQSMKFKPPTSGFSNKHVSAHDAIGGVIASWFDRQSIEIINKLLTLPTFYVVLPDLKSLWTLDWEKTEKQWGIFKSTFKKPDLGDTAKQTQAAGAAVPASKTIADSFANIGNSVKAYANMQQSIENQVFPYTNMLEGLYDVANTIPFVKITEQPIELKIPWLSAAEIYSFIRELEHWVMYYKREFERVKDIWQKLIACEKDPDDTAAMQATKCVAGKIASMILVDFDKTLKSIQENIEVLRSYLAFPKKFVKFKQELLDYVRAIACYLDTFGQLLGGWLSKIHQQIVAWAELILTIKYIVENIKKLFDLFLNFDTNCTICTNERWANWGWFLLLGLILPEIPIVQFPKWPDIVLDFSKISGAINITLPVISIRPTPIPLPPLPYIRLPDLPNISLALQLPPIPILPRLPELPDLPPPPPIPTLKLPSLPPPPKLPDIAKAFRLIIPLIEKILQVWCLLKKALSPIPESMLNDQITMMTNRPMYLIPLDLIKIQLPNIAPFDLGFNEIRIETTIYLGLRITAIIKPLEEMSATYNGWIEAIPKKMNEAYAAWLKYTEQIVQEQIDKFQAEMDKAAQLASEGCYEVDEKTGECKSSIQGAINENIGKPLEEADQAMRDKEAAMQRKADEIMPTWDYDGYVNAFDDAQKWWKENRGSIDKKINKFFDENADILHIINLVAIPFAGHIELLSEGKLKGLTDQETKAIDKGMEECAADMDACWKGTQPQSYLPPQGKLLARREEASVKNQADEIVGLLNQIQSSIDEVNKAGPVDYREIKEALGVPDYKLPNGPTEVEKLQWMRQQLLAYGDGLEKEVKEMKNVKDLYALAKVKPLAVSPYALANAQYAPDQNEDGSRVFTSAIGSPDSLKNLVAMNPSGTPSGMAAELSQKVEELNKTIKSQVSAQGGASTDSPEQCHGLCLPDPVTGQPSPFAPKPENAILSEILFVPYGTAGKSHAIVSDGDSLYFKRNLSIPEILKDNMAQPVENRIIELDDSFMGQLGQSPYLREAPDMLQAALAENGNSTFRWRESTNPKVYGYGMELERSIQGFEADRQANGLPDVKFVLLPPDENGAPPPVLADGNPVLFETLITSVKDPEQAKERFGVTPPNIITNAKQVVFPTVNNARITLGDNTAVYFGAYTNTSYSVKMKNGFYHIKITWFDKEGGVSTYTQNELLYPQAYAAAAPPMDIAFDKVYYMPVFKGKVIRASEIFTDLAGAYQYYWYVDVPPPEEAKEPSASNLALTFASQLSPVVSGQLALGPQEKPREIYIKLVATQDINDPHFKRYEKTFKVVAYVPKITLEEGPVKEGVVKGKLEPDSQSPADDLSGIPFSVFRKRWGTWKNMALQVLRKPESERTQPSPADKVISERRTYKDNYYTSGADGSYAITGFNFDDPSPIVLKDNSGNAFARVLPGSGRVQILQEGYRLDPLPATPVLPTRIVIIKNKTDELMGNVYYVPDSNTDIVLQAEPLTSKNISGIGVTVGDANPQDDVIAQNIPGSAPSEPGGAAIYNKTPPQKNVAIVGTNGAIRLMQAGYTLRIKNEADTEEPFIFQIVDGKGNPVYDVYIETDFNSLNVKQGQVMDGRGVKIGFVEPPERAVASLVVQNALAAEEPKTPDMANPFKDLDKAHPFYKEILELYKRRVVKGYEDGTFRPDVKISRAEFVKIALGVTGCYDCTNPTEPQRAKYTPNAPFPDVQLPAWYYFCVAIAKELTMVTGYGDGFFRPEKNISRAEGAAVLLRQSGIEMMQAPEKAFIDVPDYAWYKDYVYTAVKIGLVKDHFGYVFPDEEITRGEFAFMGLGVADIKDCHEKDSDKDAMPDYWEMQNNLDPQNAADAATDTDFDALTAVDEFRRGMDPNNADSNGNGIIDSKEPFPAVPSEAIPPAGICPCIDNPNKNDTDKDGIPDVCDDDIDSDGVPNELCLFDKDGLVDEAKAKASKDNCVFIVNSDQADSDQNSVGDPCEAADACPTVPEDIDGVHDQDGCPEVYDNIPAETPGVYVAPGPACDFIDKEADLAKGDKIMTAVTDVDTHSTIFESSQEAEYVPVP